MNYYNQKENITHKTNKFPLAHYRVDSIHPRYVMRHHWHREFEIVYVENGKLTLTLDRKDYDLSKGHFALISPGTIHSAVPHDCKYDCLVFDLDALVGGWKLSDKYLNGLTTHKLCVQEIYKNPQGLPETEMKKIVEIMRKLDEGFELQIVSAMFSLLYALIKSECIKESKDKFSHIKLSPFNNAIAYIEDNYKNHISIEELAKVSGVSPKYFSEYFKKITGKSPFDYINEYKIECAAEMLIYTKKNITDIALDCGFNDLSYFSKTFKQYKNKTPRQYRVESVYKV